MGIKGLTDQQAALPIIGTLRKGDEKKSANAPGKDLTHFRFTSDDPGTVTQFASLYGAEPRTINVFLPFKTTDENMDAWIEKWVAGGLEYRSDGETCVLYRTNTGFSDKPKLDPRPAVGEDGKRADGSMQVGRLSVIIPEMARLATVTVLTTSKHDIINLTRQLRSIEAINGDLRGIPFVLNRRPKMISTPAGNGKRARREKWLLSIETHQRGTMAILQQMEQKALPGYIDDIEDDTDYIIPMLPANVLNPFDDEPQHRQIEAPQHPAAPVAQAQPKPTPKATAKQPAAPLSAIQLITKFQQFTAALHAAGQYIDQESGDALPVQMHKAGDKSPQYIASTITKLVGSTDRYHAALIALTGKDSATQLTAIEAAGLFKMLFNGAHTIGFNTPVIDTAAAAFNILADMQAAPAQPALDELDAAFPRNTAYND